MASWTADQLGKATSDTAGLLRAGRQCTAWFAPRRPLAPLCGEATGMRSPCACRSFDSSARAGERVAVALFALALALAVPASMSWAATRDFHFRSISAATAAWRRTPSPRSRRMQQGFVWVGTQGGLHRYDGQRYHLFRHDPRDPATLPDSYVTALAVEGARCVVGRHVFAVRRAARPARRADPRYRDAGGAALPGSPRNRCWRCCPWPGSCGSARRPGCCGSIRRPGAATDVLALDPRIVAPSPWQALLRGRDGAIWFASAGGLYRIGAAGARSASPGTVRSQPRSIAPDAVGRPRRWPVSACATAAARCCASGPRRIASETPTCARSCRRPTATCGCRCTAVACAVSTRPRGHVEALRETDGGRACPKTRSTS